MRQTGYGQQMEAIELERQRAIEQAAQAAVSGDIQLAQRQAAATRNMYLGLGQAVSSGLAGAAGAKK